MSISEFFLTFICFIALVGIAVMPFLAIPISEQQEPAGYNDADERQARALEKIADELKKIREKCDE